MPLGNGSPSGFPVSRPFRRFPKADDPARAPLSPWGSECYAGGLAGWQIHGTAPTVTNPDLPYPGVRLNFGGSGRHIYQLLPPAPYEIVVHFSEWSNYGSMLGIHLLDASGNGKGFSPYSNPTFFYTWTVASWAYSATGNQVAESSADWVGLEDVWLAARYDGTNVKFRVSMNGKGWVAFSTTYAISPIYLAIGTLFGGGAAVTVRRVNIYQPTYTP